MQTKSLTIVTILFVAIALLFTSTAFAGRDDYVRQSNLAMKVGYRVDNLEWNIGDPAGCPLVGGCTPAGGIPNILSELTWEDVESIQTRIDGSIDVGNQRFPSITVHIRGGISYSSIMDGTVQDSDYAGDNRTLEFSRSNSMVENDDTLDLDVALGVNFSVADDKMYILPMIGYEHNEMLFVATDGVQTVSDQAAADGLFGPGVVTLPPLGPFTGLHSTYEAEMDGPVLGLELGFNPYGKFRARTGISYHSVEYVGIGNWNLRSDLAHPRSFEHKADMDGWTADLGIDIALGTNWMLTLTGDYRFWETEVGQHVTFFSDGTEGLIPFTGAEWESYSGMAGFKYQF